LGENVQDPNRTNFENALVVLIRDVIKVVAPSAKIVMTGLFWSDAQKEAAIVNAASRTNVTYVEIDQYDTAEYKETVGGLSYDTNGNAYYLNNAAVAAHPSDRGMEMIAKEILDAIL
jgi:alpha-galactosidase